jgi:hypothetical protein
VQATLDDNDINEGDARGSRLSVAILILLWLAVPLAALVMQKSLAGH